MPSAWRAAVFGFLLLGVHARPAAGQAKETKADATWATDCKVEGVQAVLDPLSASPLALQPSLGDFYGCEEGMAAFAHQPDTKKYCLLQGSLNVGAGIKLPLLQGECLPKKCSSADYKLYKQAQIKDFEKQVNNLENQTKGLIQTSKAISAGGSAGNSAGNPVLAAMLKQSTAMNTLQASAKQIAQIEPFIKQVRGMFPIFEGYVKGLRVHCTDDESLKVHMSFGSQCLVCFVVTFFVLTLAATIADFLDFEHDLMSIFSARHNYKRLVAPMKGEFGALNGFRFISMGWVILGHVVLIVGTFNPFSQLRVAKVFNDFSFTIIISAFFAVDTFFFMSGLLGAHGLLNKLEGEWGGKLTPARYGLMVLMRFLRLTPLLAIMLFMMMGVVPFLIQGPFRYNQLESMQDPNDVCNKYWWSVVMYVNNVVPWAKQHGGYQNGSNGCMGWTWYLANDMQFFLMLPFLCVVYLKRPKNAFVLIGVLVAIQYIACTVVISGLDLDKGVWLNPEFNHSLYNTPWARWTPYFLGACTTFMYRLEEDTWRKLTPRRARYMWVVAVALMAITVFGVYDDYRCDTTDMKTDCVMKSFFSKGNWGMFGEWFYHATAYTMWSISLGCFTLLFASGRGSVFLSFLSHPCFTPLARLTYGAYLVHLIIISAMVNSLDAVVPFSKFDIGVKYVGIFALAYLSSFFTFLCLEKPIMNIVARLTKRCLGSARAAPAVENPGTALRSSFVTPGQVHAQEHANKAFVQDDIEDAAVHVVDNPVSTSGLGVGGVAF